MVLGSLSAFGALTIDMYLPAMPSMAGELGTSGSLVQLTLTVFVVGLAVGQVIVGPLSDAWGRRRPLLIGTALYVGGSLWCALAPTVEWLIGGRVLQALGAAAGTVLARAIVRDLFEGVAMTRFFSTLMLVNGVAPIIAPVIGGQLLAFTTWRVVFGVLAATGALILMAAAWALPESLPTERRRPADFRTVVASFAGLIADVHYLRHVIAAALMFAAVFAYISGSSFVLQDGYGLSAQQFSLVFAANGVGIVVLGQLNGFLVGRVAGEAVLLRVGLTIATVGAAGVLTCGAADLPLPLLEISLFVMTSMFGLVMTNATSLALSAHASAAGAASSLQGLLQFLIGAIAASAMTLTGPATATAMGATMLMCTAGALTLMGRRPMANETAGPVFEAGALLMPLVHLDKNSSSAK
nr:multidrug effflux MFS transporter [Kineosporia mesophila]